ncbi:unnamed protein product [Spodoptera exigua]|nr:unnamed protein product [Spodoptera exigua]
MFSRGCGVSAMRYRDLGTEQEKEQGVVTNRALRPEGARRGPACATARHCPTLALSTCPDNRSTGRVYWTESVGLKLRDGPSISPCGIPAVKISGGFKPTLREGVLSPPTAARPGMLPASSPPHCEAHVRMGCPCHALRICTDGLTLEDSVKLLSSVDNFLLLHIRADTPHRLLLETKYNTTLLTGVSSEQLDSEQKVCDMIGSFTGHGSQPRGLARRGLPPVPTDGRYSIISRSMRPRLRSEQLPGHLPA